MSKITAICGLVCSNCIAFIATQKNDNKLREKAVESWSTDKKRLRLEDINCDGCTVGKRLCPFCRLCDVRKCGLKRNIKNCAYCSEFQCEKLEKLFRRFRTVYRKEAKANLAEIKKEITTNK
jgi:hypothetical protein